ncbi:hypothetical protein V3C99_003629 [Haemonchus contortus]|uniref:Uncharacterized protein n=1 Tax=Haemonchus contortus TaxID=6289 RepID=A0A7I4XYN3_HAECO
MQIRSVFVGLKTSLEARGDFQGGTERFVPKYSTSRLQPSGAAPHAKFADHFGVTPCNSPAGGQPRPRSRRRAVSLQNISAHPLLLSNRPLPPAASPVPCRRRRRRRHGHHDLVGWLAGNGLAG